MSHALISHALMQALNSQLLKESAALDWTQGVGHTTAAAAAPSSESGPSYSGPHARLMAATAASSGQTLAQLSSHDPITGASAASPAAGGQIPGMGHVDSTTAAAEAAMARLGTPQGAQSPGSKATRPQSPDAKPFQQVSHSHEAPAGHCCDGALHECIVIGEAAEPDAAISMDSESLQETPLAMSVETSVWRDISTEQETAVAAAAASRSLSDEQHGSVQPETTSVHDVEAETAARSMQAVPADEVLQTSGPAHEGHCAAEGPTPDQPWPASAPDKNSNGPADSPSAASPGASAADAEDTPGSFSHDNDDPGAARYQRAERAAQELVREAGGGDSACALATLATILQVWPAVLLDGMLCCLVA